MSRVGSIAALVAAAALSSGYGSPQVIRSLDDEFEGDEHFRRAMAKRQAERQATADRIAERQAARAKERQDYFRRKQEDAAKLEAGIDPTNDRPLSRQQRRRRAMGRI